MLVVVFLLSSCCALTQVKVVVLTQRRVLGLRRVLASLEETVGNATIDVEIRVDAVSPAIREERLFVTTPACLWRTMPSIKP